MIVGIDEAGRGPLAGVVVGCALFLKASPPALVRDSKELTAAERLSLFDWIIDNSIYSVNVATPQEIDQFNILQATFLTFNRAIADLLQKEPKLKQAEYIVDGNMFCCSHDINYKCVVKADKTVKEVSCASIVAKVTRDHLMETADFLYPQWKFKEHKGYPTKQHYSLIAKHGISPLHRKSFRLG